MWVKFSDHNLFDIIHGFVFGDLCLAPSFTTAFLAITRYIQITFPFRPLPARSIVAGLLLMMLFPSIVHLILLCTANENTFGFFVIFQTAFLLSQNERVIICVMAVQLLFAVTGAICTILTLVHLLWRYFHPVSAGSHLPLSSSLRVVILNILSIISCTSIFYDLWHIAFPSEGFSVMTTGRSHDTLKGAIVGYLSWIVIPVLTSLADPIVYLIFAAI